MKHISIIIFSLFLSFNATASDDYRIGDNLFIWAKSGLNLRVGPGTQYGVVTKLGFGADVYVTGRSSKKYNSTCVSKTDTTYYYKSVDPLILYGNWVKVMTTKGKEGYVIDQYLLSIQPFNKDTGGLPELNFKLLSIDTVFKSPIIYDGSGLNSTVNKRYENEILVINTEGGVWGQTTITFPNLSIEEVLVILGSSLYKLEDFRVIKNWNEEIILTDGELCSLELKVVYEGVVVKQFCSC